ncbi:MAG: cupredoxin domain-containing protein [Nitrosopumilaceae archaeon]
MSQTTSSHAYGITIITLVVGLSVGIGYYQMFYIPEQSAKPAVSEHILHPDLETVIKMIPGSALEAQQDNFVPKLLNIQLGIDNHLIWINDDDVPHTVTPDHRLEDSYSGEFGSTGVVLPGESYEFLFTEDHEIDYHCTPHPWMKGKIIITKQRF